MFIWRLPWSSVGCWERIKGWVSQEHLDAYLDEFIFDFNRRKSRSRGKLFCRLLQQAVAVEPVPYKSLVTCSVEPIG